MERILGGSSLGVGSSLLYPSIKVCGDCEEGDSMKEHMEVGNSEEGNKCYMCGKDWE